MDWFAHFMAYAQHCVSKPLGYPDCNALWGAVFLTGLCIVGIVAIRLIYRTNAQDEQRAIEDIIKGRAVRARDAAHPHRGREAEAIEAASYEKMLGKIGEDARKAKDAYQ